MTRPIQASLALEAALPVLRTQLAESGIQLGQSNISGESFSGQQQAASQQQQSQRTANHEPLAGEDDDTLPVPVSLQGRVTGNSGVDQQPMLSVTKAIPFQSGIFADVWRVTQERYYQVKKVCRTALINPALICLEQFGVSFSGNGANLLI